MNSSSGSSAPRNIAAVRIDSVPPISKQYDNGYLPDLSLGSLLSQRQVDALARKRVRGGAGSNPHQKSMVFLSLPM